MIANEILAMVAGIHHRPARIWPMCRIPTDQFRRNLATLCGFRPASPESGWSESCRKCHISASMLKLGSSKSSDNGLNLETIAGFRHIDMDRLWRPVRIPVTESQNLGTFGGKFQIPPNFNAWWWWIPTNVHARMTNLNSKNWIVFQKLKKIFQSNWKWFMLPINFGTEHRKIEKLFFKKYFTPKQTYYCCPYIVSSAR